MQYYCVEARSRTMLSYFKQADWTRRKALFSIVWMDPSLVFRAGSVFITAIYAFNRQISMKYTIDMPLINPNIPNKHGDRISNHPLPANWVISAVKSSCHGRPHSHGPGRWHFSRWHDDGCWNPYRRYQFNGSRPRYQNCEPTLVAHLEHALNSLCMAVSAMTQQTMEMEP